MINLDVQKIYSSIKYHNTEKWIQPLNIDREETRDNHQGNAKNRQQSSYQEVLNLLTDKLAGHSDSHFAYIV